MLVESSAIRAVQAFSLVQTAFAWGLNLTLSYISIPTILQSPSPVLAVRQWHTQFEKGVTLVMPLCVIALASSLYLTYATYSLAESSLTWKLYLVASLCSFAIFPFTLTIVQPINNKLVAKSEEVKTFGYTDLPDKDAGISSNIVHNDIQRWGTLNWLRSTMLATTVLASTLAIFFSE